MHGKEVYESDWRASLVPAAAVIPAPGASVCIAAVKTCVVWLATCKKSGVLSHTMAGTEALRPGRGDVIWQRGVKTDDLLRSDRGASGHPERV